MRCLILFCPEGKKFNFALFVFCHSFHLIIFTVDVALIRNIFIFLFVKLLAQEPPVWPSAVTAKWVFVLPEGGVLLSSFWLVALFFTYIFKYYIYIAPLNKFSYSAALSQKPNVAVVVLWASVTGFSGFRDWEKQMCSCYIHGKYISVSGKKSGACRCLADDHMTHWCLTALLDAW